MNTAQLFVSLPAQAAQQPGFDPSFFLMMGVIFMIFYFLVIRPQQRKQRGLEDSIKSAAKGDRVVTSGGLHGKIVSTSDDVFTLEIATVKGGQSVRVDVSRAKVESVSSAKAKDDASEKDEKKTKKDKKEKGGGGS